MLNPKLLVKEKLQFVIDVCGEKSMENYIIALAENGGLKEMCNYFGWDGGTVWQVIEEAKKRRAVIGEKWSNLLNG